MPYSELAHDLVIVKQVEKYGVLLLNELVDCGRGIDDRLRCAEICDPFTVRRCSEIKLSS